MAIFKSQSSTARTKNLVALNNIHIAAPCRADWAQMSGDERVRHCSECDLNVYNLSEMTRAEAERLILSREGRLCVRFYRRSDGTILTQNCPRGVRVLIRRVSRIAAAILTATMSVGSTLSYAASKKPSQAQENPATGGIDVTVMDPSGARVQNAKTILCRCKDHVSLNANSNATGIAHFSGLAEGTYFLEIHSAGFKVARHNVKIRRRKLDNLEVKLQIAPANVTVEVKTEPVAWMGAVMGEVTPINAPFPWPTQGLGGRPGAVR